MTAVAPSGPYECEQDTLAEPMPREVRALYDTGRIRVGDPGHLARDTVLGHLLVTCGQARVELGDHDLLTLMRLAKWEPSAVQVVIGVITRAYAAGWAARESEAKS